MLNFRVDYTAYIDKSNESPLLINSQEQTQSELPRQIGKLNILQKYHNNVFDIKKQKSSIIITIQNNYYYYTLAQLRRKTATTT